jgi:hypothetical protein
MTPKNLRWAWMAVGSVFAALLLYSSGIFVGSALARDTQTFSTEIDQPVRRVVVDNTLGGEVRIVGTDHDTVLVDAVLDRGLVAPTHTETVTDGTLELTARCDSPGPIDLAAFCSVRYTVQVPSDVDVVVEADGGFVSVEGVDGDLDLSADGGTVELREVSGDVQVSSDGGSVTGTDVSSAVFTASSDGGGIDVQFSAAPQTVDASSDGGSVTLLLPDTDDTYRLDTSADGGSEVLDVRTDPASDRLITASSDGGSVTLRYRSD